jgi:glycosyltransferase involved in cell wall biosynthesis
MSSNVPNRTTVAEQQMSLPEARGDGPLVTALIPTRNRVRLLRRAIRSVQAQSELRIQIHICDNASTDGTFDFVTRLAEGDARLRAYRNASDIGAFANFQSALATVRTPYFSILSDDDVISPCLYERALDAFARNPRAAVFFSDVVHVGDGNRVFKRPLQRWSAGQYAAPSGLELMTNLGRPEWTGAVFRTDRSLSHGALLETLRLHADVEFTLRIAAREEILIDCVPGAVFNVSTSHRAPYRFSDLKHGCAALAQEVGTWTSIPSSLAERVIKAHYDELACNLHGRYLAYCLANMPEEAALVADHMRHACRLGLAMRSFLLATSRLAHYRPTSALLSKAQELRRRFRCRQLPTFDARYCLETGVPTGLLTAWRL